MIVCLRWVDSKLEPHEDFIGLHYVDDITTNTIVHTLKDSVLSLNLNMSMCHAQCYDGASNKTYLRSSVTQTRLNVIVVHVHKHLTDSVDCVKVLNEFASANEDRKTHFGKF